MGLSVGERQWAGGGAGGKVGGRSGGEVGACLMPPFPSCFRSRSDGRSDGMAVVEVGRVQAVIMPLSPLLHRLPGPLFLL